MKKTAGFVVSFFALLLLSLSPTIIAETVTANVLLTPGAEITPPVPPPVNASGTVAVTINITRSGTGAITAATMNFRGTFSFPSSVSVVGFHIHESPVNANGPIRFDTGVNTGSAIFFATGTGFIDLNTVSVDLTILQRLLSNPSGFYVNLHTSVNPAGAIRGQITSFVETLGNTVPLTTAQEVSPPVPLPAGASGIGTFTLNPIRNPLTGEITGGSFGFTANANLPPGSTVVGLHIHQGVAGVNGPIVLDSRISATNSVPLTTGVGTITAETPITTAAQLTAFRGVVANPTGFYINLHTTANPAGVIRGQLTTVTDAPVIQTSNVTFLNTGGAGAPVNLWVTGLGFAGTIFANGQAVPSLTNTTSALTETSIPASLLANPGVVHLQARASTGPWSAPFSIVVAGAGNVNTVALTTLDAARWGSTGAPDAIVAGFGSRLASQMVMSTTQPLPTSLDGTSVYVNGTAAGLQYVSAGQINYVLPAGTTLGPAQVVVLARDGTVSRGTINVANTVPAVFTRKGDGTGAPSGVASVDGVAFNILLSNADGTPVTIDINNYVSVFGTGLRYPGTPTTITLGGTAITPLYVGPQGQFDGLDQVNFRVAPALAGRGEIDLIISQDGKTTNMVRMRIR